MYQDMQTDRKKEYIKDVAWILSGTALMAVSSNLFFEPAHMVPGGFTGLAMMIQHLTVKLIEGGIPVWLGNIILNVPLILMSIRTRGWKFMSRTFIAAMLFSFWLFVLPVYELVPSDPVITAIIGGALMGLGLGLVFQGKATTGGTDTLAALLQRLMPHIGVAKILPVLDAIIILLSFWIFGLRISMYAVISVFLSGLVADYVIGGFRNAKFAYIFSKKHEEIGRAVINELGRGATLFSAKGMYTGDERPVLVCAVAKREIVVLKDLVASIDPDAFFVVTDAQEIRGEGFLEYTNEEL